MRPVCGLVYDQKDDEREYRFNLPREVGDPIGLGARGATEEEAAIRATYSATGLATGLRLALDLIERAESSSVVDVLKRVLADTERGSAGLQANIEAGDYAAPTLRWRGFEGA